MNVLFEKSLSQAFKDSGKKIYSFTTKINPCDPLDFFDYDQSVYKGQRFFWRSSDQETTIVGLGMVDSITNESNEDRFKNVEQQWEKVLNVAEIHNPYHVPGTGPLLFGGFSFDDKQGIESEWNDFGEAFFMLPKIMLTISHGEYFLTVNEQSVQDMEELSRIAQSLTINKKDRTATPIMEVEEIEPDVWVEKVIEIVEELKTTDLQKVVLARKLKVLFEDLPSISNIIEQLLIQQPTSFIFTMELGGSCFIGASPERLVKITGREVLSTCLAGSARRGQADDEDQRLGDALLHDPKNRFEHELVVSMIEDALRPYCEQLSIPDEPTLMKTPNIQHLYTPVVGEIKEDSSIFAIVKELHPTPALGGVPTRKAMDLIREKEKMDRGFYGSPIGWVDHNDNGEFIVGIRSGLINDTTAYLYAGCGLVADSIPEKELRETRVKFEPMLRAIGGNLE